MHSLKDRVFLLVIGCVVCLMMSLMLVFYFYVRSTELKAVENKAKADLATAEAIIDLKHPGPWQIREGELYKGGVCINNNNILVDYIGEITGDICAIYMNNICVATTVLEGGCNRGVGSYAPQEVRSIYLDAGQYYTARTEMGGKAYHTAFKAITDEYGQLIGVLYVGVPGTFYRDVLYGPLRAVGIAGLALTFLMGLLARWLVARTVAEPLQKALPGVEYESSKPEQASESCSKEDEWFDALFDPQMELPKGLNRSTLKQIVLFLKKEEGNDVTIRDVSKALCLSKVTVGRYFDYLEENGLVDVEQKYGSVGRPLRIFKLKV